MCYSEFSDIIEAIAQVDADVITIETSRSDMELLDAFDQVHYPNEIGPRVYDIHLPNILSIDSMIHLMKKAAQRIPAQKIMGEPGSWIKNTQLGRGETGVAKYDCSKPVIIKQSGA